MYHFAHHSHDFKASCLDVNDKLIVFGSYTGKVFIVDHFMNTTNTIDLHSAKINQIRIVDDSLLTCSDDGQIAVYSLFSGSVSSYAHSRPVKSVVAFNDINTLVSGGLDSNLYITTKGWLTHKHTTVHSDEGAIHTIAYHKHHIAFATDTGIRLFDSLHSQKFGFIPITSSFQRDLYPCSIKFHVSSLDSFAEDSASSMTSLSPSVQLRILVSWHNTLIIGAIKQRSRADVSSGLTHYYLDLSLQLELDEIILGFSPYISPLDGIEKLMLFTLDFDPDDDISPREQPSAEIVMKTMEDLDKNTPLVKEEQKLYLKTVTYSGNITDSTTLPLTHSPKYKPTDYQISYFENTFYVLNPFKLVFVTPYTTEEAVSEFMSNKEYKNAVEFSHKYLSSDDTNRVLSIYLEELWNLKEYSTLVHELEQYTDDSVMWKAWLERFVEKDLVHLIIGRFPVRIELDLGQEMEILKKLLTHPEIFKNRLVKVNRYDKDQVIKMLVDERDKDLVECLFHVYKTHSMKEEAVDLALSSHFISGLLEYVKEVDLVSLLKRDVIRALKYQETTGINLISYIIENSQDSEIDLISNILQNTYSKTKIQYLFQKELESSKRLVNADAYVELLAKYDPSNLVHFLKHNQNYSVEKALAICESYNHITSVVYLLTLLGDFESGISYIVAHMPPYQIYTYMQTQTEWNFFLQKVKESKRRDIIPYFLEQETDFEKVLDLVVILDDGRMPRIGRVIEEQIRRCRMTEEMFELSRKIMNEEWFYKFEELVQNLTIRKQDETQIMESGHVERVTKRLYM